MSNAVCATILKLTFTDARVVCVLWSCVVVQEEDGRRFNVLVTDISCAQTVWRAHHWYVLSARLYRNAFYVIVYVCTHLHCAYSGSSLFNLQIRMAKCRISMEGSTACEETKFIKYNSDMRCNSRVLIVLCSVPSQNLYGLISPIIQIEVIQWVPFSIGQVSLRSFSELVQSHTIGKS